MRPYYIPVRLLLICLISAVFSTPFLGAFIPPLIGHVNDTAGMFSEPVRAEVERLLAKHESRTTNQVVVVTVPSLEGEILEEYSIRLAETWKIGQKGKDNGVILLFSRDDRKLRIEVGYGLEGTLTDLMAGRIIRNNIVPHFKDGRFDDGLRSGVNGILRILDTKNTGDDLYNEPAQSPETDNSLSHKIFKYLSLIFFVAFLGITALGILYFFISMAFFHTGVIGWINFVLLGPVFFMVIFLPILSVLETSDFAVGYSIAAGVLIAALLIGLKIFFLYTRRGQDIAEELQIDLSGDSGGGS
ncbi:MAG: TPM domain-containing protein, partial [Spirochaetota bacterium]|nr:TPM domain-containing protein [Spirochaetota bacterium]